MTISVWVNELPVTWFVERVCRSTSFFIQRSCFPIVHFHPKSTPDEATGSTYVNSTSIVLLLILRCWDRSIFGFLKCCFFWQLRDHGKTTYINPLYYPLVSHHFDPFFASNRSSFVVEWCHVYDPWAYATQIRRRWGRVGLEFQVPLNHSSTNWKFTQEMSVVTCQKICKIVVKHN